ncbi:MAG: PaaI family thioesterase [Flavobacteriaceae bacterium]|nr:PaaI family thioesterase [Flavobacteriaceae bacterium]
MNKEMGLQMLNMSSKNTLMETLEIKYTEIGEDYLKATMPVTSKVYQPMGVLHGGASIAFAESIAGAASMVFIDRNKYTTRGIEVSANHIKSVKDGLLTATAKTIHSGTRTHLWEIRIVDEKGDLVSICKVTNIILRKEN